MQIVCAALAGLVFGLGLLLSGMADPAKVIGFLDLAGRWDPSLAFVMAGAIAVAAPAFYIAKRRTTAWSGVSMRLPPAGAIDGRLIGGSLLFGIGWGIAGFCPGPALVALGTGSRPALWFSAAMLAGMALQAVLDARRAPAPDAAR